MKNILDSYTAGIKKKVKVKIRKIKWFQMFNSTTWLDLIYDLIVYYNTNVVIWNLINISLKKLAFYFDIEGVA